MTTPTIPTFEPPPSGDSPAPSPVTVPAQAPSSGRSKGSGLLNLALGVALVVAVAGIAFALGRSTAPATIATVGAGGLGGTGVLPGASFDLGGGVRDGGGPVGGFGMGGGLTIEGTVDSVTADSVTVRTAGGETVTVGLDSDTTYHAQAAAAGADVTTGATIIVRLDGGFRPGANGNGAANGAVLGSADDVTVVP